MGHQYSSAPSYGAQYPPATPYYAPFTPSAGQPINNDAPAFQQPNAHNTDPSLSSPTPNTVPYDLNAQVHALPTQLPFAPQFNPDFLKHFPPPPPPPPVPHTTHFAAAPSAAMGYLFPPPLNASHNQIPQPNYPQPPQPQTQLGVDPVRSPKPTTIQETRSYHVATPAQNSNVPLGQLHAHRQRYSSSVGTQSALLSDGNVGRYDHTSALGKSSRMDGEPGTSKEPLSHGIDGALVNGYPRPQVDTGASTLQPASEIELRERAKAALLSLVPHNIRYEDLLAEGIDPHLLQRLYDELGLGWQPSANKSEREISKPLSTTLSKTEISKLSSQVVPAPTPASANNPTLAKISPAATPASRASPVISSGMARKDLIAQRLAAKAEKAANAGAASKSQSPAPTISPAAAPTAQLESQQTSTSASAVRPFQRLAQADSVRQRLDHITKEIVTKTQAAQSSGGGQSFVPNDTNTDTYQVQLAASLPTPIREHLVQNGLSSIIPGLFMTSADLDEDVSIQSDQKPVQVEEIHAMLASALPANQSQTTQPSHPPQKRTIEHLSEDGDPPTAKRQTIQADAPVTVSMEVDDAFTRSASEGEIIEEELPTQQDHQPAPQTTSAVARQTQTAAHDHPNKRIELDTRGRRNAEMEPGKNPKRGQSYGLSPNGSANSTPLATQAPHVMLSPPSSKAPDRITTSSTVDERTDQSSTPLAKATPELMAIRAAKLKADILEKRKAHRQKQLQDSIVPALSKEVVETQTRLKEAQLRLAEIRKELQEFETKMTRTRETEGQLIQEVERLQKQVSEGASNQKPLANDLNALQRSNGDTSVPPLPAQDASTREPKDLASMPDSTLNQPLNVLSPRTDIRDLPTEPLTLREEPQLAEGPSPVFEPVEEHLQAKSASRDPENLELDHAIENVATEDSLARRDYGRELSASQVSTESPEQQPQSIAEQNDDSDESMDESDEDSDDSRMSIDEESNDSASMSDSGSDEYEPAEPEHSHESDEKAESEEYEPGVDGNQPDVEMFGEGDDDYEPTEDYVQAEDVSLVDSNEDSAAAHDSPTPSTTAPTGSTYQGDRDATDQAEAVSQMPETVEMSKTDDLENGLQLSEANTLTKPQTLPVDGETDGPDALGATEPSPVRYVPYQSPLSSFKSYRFHPFFNDSVKDGYRSLTYSHKIDPKLPLCPSELAGSACTDPECTGQHFGSMALTDGKILVQMSSASDIRDKDLRDQYLIGLKSVIARLRTDGVKEFVAVADALSQYRRDWIAAQTGY